MSLPERIRARRMSTICWKLPVYPAADFAVEISLNETLVATCQMFLVPATILFAAVGVANTRFVKLLVCLLGVAVAALWIYRIWLWAGLSLIDRRTGLGIAGLFGICWVLTLLHQVKSMFTGGYDRR
jgi:hypothetical protein